MPEYDVTDETIVDADAPTVFKALLDEMRGVTHWWMPYLELIPVDGPLFGQPGGAVHIKSHGFGGPQFTAVTSEVVHDSLIRAEYSKGDYLGSGEWNLKPENGKTRLSFRWKVRPNGLMFKLASPFVNAGKLHSAIMKKGFAGLKRYLETNPFPT